MFPCVSGTFGQPEMWDIYNPTTYQHPMVPYDVLVDPMSMPTHPVIAEKRTTHEVLLQERDGDEKVYSTNKINQGFFFSAMSTLKHPQSAGVCFHMYRGHPCQGLNTACPHSNPPRWPLGQIPTFTFTYSTPSFDKGFKFICFNPRETLTSNKLNCEASL
jgi:hypothetical protein